MHAHKCGPNEFCPVVESQQVRKHMEAHYPLTASYEPPSRVLGQCGDGKLILDAED